MGSRLHNGVFIADYSDPPFACPPDIVLDLPAPPSVNRTRRHDWANHRVYEDWRQLADRHVIAGKKYQPIDGAYELHITVSTRLRLDLDNPLKSLIDYLRRIKLVRNDSQKYLRKITVEWGDPPEGVRVIVRAVEMPGFGKLTEHGQRKPASPKRSWTVEYSSNARRHLRRKPVPTPRMVGAT